MRSLHICLRLTHLSPSFVQPQTHMNTCITFYQNHFDPPPPSPPSPRPPPLPPAQLTAAQPGRGAGGSQTAAAAAEVKAAHDPGPIYCGQGHTVRSIQNLWGLYHVLLPTCCRDNHRREQPVLASITHCATAQHSTAQHSTAQHSTAQHSTAQHSTAQHSTAQHSTA
jgi:hypothetical protein